MSGFVTEVFALLGVGLFVIGLRLYVRISTVGIKRLQPDDYLMVLAAVIYSMETYLAYSVGVFWKGLANNAMTDEERKSLSPDSMEYYLRVNGSKTQVAGWCTYTFLLWIIKASMCTFYLRLTEGLMYHRRIYTGFVMIFISWIAVLFSILFACYPLRKNWQIYPDPGNFCQPAISKVDIIVTVVLNVLTDIYLMSIPIPMLLKASLRPLKKAGLIFLFSGGIFVTVAGILRCALIILDPINGAQKAGSWAVRETFVAVVASNLPMIFPLVAKIARPLFGSLRSITSQKPSKYNSRSGDLKLGQPYRLEDKNPRRGLGPRSVNPLTSFSLNESVEQICIEEMEGARQPPRRELDMEAASGGGRCPSRGGIIVKQTSVEVTKSRKSRFPTDETEDIGDYYLVQQSRMTGPGRV
ncbi:hypothetical protein QBC38DRAFT_511101 [Podospora fimiseda]|uniref:Rhodopsin domain-containing protein n=1 Tax=Podospora fimiseda TaxID=252190 RepID=A0AAN7BLA1_9PEZI|nr:hypothetical protein QBC38DRAFT_511101 [Podospora fimiseda]